MMSRRHRHRAARAGLFAWSLGFVLAPLAHLWAHRADHHHHGEGIRWTLAAPAHDHAHGHPHDHTPAPHVQPVPGPDGGHDLDHAEGAGHLHATVLPAPVVLPIFEGRLPAHTHPAGPSEAPPRARAWCPQHPRAPPVA